MLEKRSAIVIGATGLTGSHLVKWLCESEAYIAVHVIARKALSYEHPKLDVLVKDFDTIEENDLEVAHDFFCCLGTTIKTAGSKEAFEKVDLTHNTLRDEALSGLLILGFNKTVASKAIDRVLKSGSVNTVEDLIKEALKKL